MAPPIAEQFVVALAWQLSHCLETEIGAVPAHVPVVEDRVLPTDGVPVTAGGTVADGATGALDTRAVAAEVATALPGVLVAVTWLRRRRDRSLAVSV